MSSVQVEHLEKVLNQCKKLGYYSFSIIVHAANPLYLQLEKYEKKGWELTNIEYPANDRNDATNYPKLYFKFTPEIETHLLSQIKSERRDWRNDE